MKFGERSRSYSGYTFVYMDIVFPGEAFEWNQQVRIQHLLTFHYLCIREDKVTLCKDPTDPVTVFKLHPMYDVSQFSHKPYIYYNNVHFEVWIVLNLEPCVPLSFVNMFVTCLT